MMIVAFGDQGCDNVISHASQDGALANRACGRAAACVGVCRSGSRCIATEQIRRVPQDDA